MNGRWMALLLASALLPGCQSAGRDTTSRPCYVHRASVEVECTTTKGRPLTECVVLNETAPGCGFAEAALNSLIDGSPPRRGKEGRVRFTVRYTAA